MPNGQIEQYYDYLKKSGADVPPSVESFKTTLSNDNSANQYYKYLKKNNFDAPDTYDSFANTLGLKKKDGLQSSTNGGGQSGQLPSPVQSPSGVPLSNPADLLQQGINGNGVQLPKPDLSFLNTKPDTMGQQQPDLTTMPTQKEKDFEVQKTYEAQQNTLDSRLKAKGLPNTKLNRDAESSNLLNDISNSKLKISKDDKGNYVYNRMPSIAQSFQKGVYDAIAGLHDTVKILSTSPENQPALQKEIADRKALEQSANFNLLDPANPVTFNTEKYAEPNIGGYVAHMAGNMAPDFAMAAATGGMNVLPQSALRSSYFLAKDIGNTATDLYNRKVDQLTKQGMPVEDAQKQASESLRSDATLASIPNTMLQTYMFHEPIENPALNNFGKLFGDTPTMKALDNIANTLKTSKLAKAATVIGLGGASEGTTQGIEQAQGYKPDYERIGQNIKQFAVMETFMNSVGMLGDLPKYAKSYVKEAAIQPEIAPLVSESLKNNPNGAAIAQEFNDYAAQTAPVRAIVPADKMNAGIGGRVELINGLKKSIDDLKAQKAKLPESLHDNLDEAIGNIQARIDKANGEIGSIQKGTDPISLEHDDITGEPAQQSISSLKNSDDGESDKAQDAPSKGQGQDVLKTEGAVDETAPVLKEQTQPIKQLGTGANVYFETPKYRVNEDTKNGGYLLNVGSINDETPLASISFDSPKEAVFVAKKLEENAPNGLDGSYHNVNGIIDSFKSDYQKEQELPTQEVNDKPAEPKKSITPQKTLSGLTEEERVAQVAERSKESKVSTKIAADNYLVDLASQYVKQRTGENKDFRGSEATLAIIHVEAEKAGYTAHVISGTTRTIGFKKNGIWVKLKKLNIGERNISITNDETALLANREKGIGEIFKDLYDNGAENIQVEDMNRTKLNNNQVNQAISDVRDGIPSHGAKAYLDALQDIKDTGRVKLLKSNVDNNPPSLKEYLDSHNPEGYEPMPKEEFNKWLNEEANNIDLDNIEKEIYDAGQFEGTHNEYVQQSKRGAKADSDRQGKPNSEIEDSPTNTKQSSTPSETTTREDAPSGTTERKVTEVAKSTLEPNKQQPASGSTADTATTSPSRTSNGQQSRRSSSESVKDKFQKAADLIRKGKIEDDILMSGIPFSKQIWNGAVEAFAKTIELTGDATQALTDALDHIKQSDWYKELTDDQKTRAENRFKKDYEKIDVEELASSNGDANLVGVNHASLNDLAERLGLPEIERGTYLTKEQYADRGRILLKADVDPYKLDEYKGELSDKIAIARAHEEILYKKVDAIKDRNSSEYKTALKEFDDYSKNIAKVLGTKAGEAMYALQGSRDIDTDSFISVSRQVQDNSSTDLTPKQTANIDKLTTTIKTLKTKLEEAENRFNDEANNVHNGQPIDNTKALKDAEDKFNKLQDEHDNLQKEIEALKKPKEPAASKFTERKEVRKELLEKIDERLKTRFDSVREKLKAQRSQFNANPIPLDIVPDLVNIAKDLIAKGVIKAADIVDTIYHELKDDLGDATERDLRDAISKYGQTTKPGDDPIAQKLSEIKSVMRLTSAIEDANNGEPPLKSGFQRPEPSQDLRDLRKQLNDAIKKNNISAIDGEKHMKSLLDAAKKRMQNSIDDLTKAIDNNEKMPKRENGVKYDDKANELKAKRKELRTRYDKIFGTDKELTPEEKEQRKVNQLQGQLEDLQNGVIKGKATDKVTSDRIEDLQNQISKIKGDNNLKSLQSQLIDKKGNKFTPEEAKDIWNYTKEAYINKGVKYVDAIKLVGNDLGLTFDQVSHAIVTPKLKPIMDDVWKNRKDLAKYRNATQRYVDDQTQNPALKAFKKVTNAIREEEVFGHGGVFVGTHSGMTLFDNPRRSIHTIKSFFNAYKLAYGKDATYERMMTELKSQDNYVMAQRAGLKNNPDVINSDSEVHKPMFGRLSESGTRGFNSIKILRQALFDSHWNDTPESYKSDLDKSGVSLAAIQIARIVNLATGATTVKLPSAINDITFAGGMEAARWQKLLQNPVLAANSAYKILLNPSKATVSDRVFLKVWSSRVGWQLGLGLASLSVNAAIQSMVHPNNKVNITDWKKSDFLKFKFGKDVVVDPTSGMVSALHFIATLAAIPFKTKKERGGDTETVSYAKALTHYGRGKLAPAYSLAADVATKHDFSGNTLPFSNETPDNKFSHHLTYGEYLWSRSPLPIAEAAKVFYESAHQNGVSNKTTDNVVKGVLYGLGSGLTGIRSYEDNNATKNGKGGNATW